MNSKLTHKQQLFVDHYIENGGNGTAAAREAGYKGSDNTLKSIAQENLTKPDIKTAIDDYMTEMKQQLSYSSISKREALWKAARRCMGELPQIDAKGNDSDEYKFDVSGMVRCIAELNKMDGDYAPTQTHEIGDKEIQHHLDDDTLKRLRNHIHNGL